MANASAFRPPRPPPELLLSMSSTICVSLHPTSRVCTHLDDLEAAWEAIGHFILPTLPSLVSQPTLSWLSFTPRLVFLSIFPCLSFTILLPEGIGSAASLSGRLLSHLT